MTQDIIPPSMQQFYTFGALSLAVPVSWVDNTVINLVGPPVGRFRPNVTVTRQIVPPMTMLSTWGQQQAQILENSGLPEFEILHQDVVRVDGQKFYLFCYTWNHPPQSSEGNPERLYQAQYTMISPTTSMAYIITFTCLAESAEDLAPLAEQIVQSLTITL